LVLDLVFDPDPVPVLVQDPLPDPVPVPEQGPDPVKNKKTRSGSRLLKAGSGFSQKSSGSTTLVKKNLFLTQVTGKTNYSFLMILLEIYNLYRIWI
jgi:hypothetical protein